FHLPAGQVILGGPSRIRTCIAPVSGQALCPFKLSYRVTRSLLFFLEGRHFWRSSFFEWLHFWNGGYPQSIRPDPSLTANKVSVPLIGCLAIRIGGGSSPALCKSFQHPVNGCEDSVVLRKVRADHLQ